MHKKHKTTQPSADNPPRVPVPPPTADLGADNTPPAVDAETERLLNDMQKQADADSSVAPPAATKKAQPRTDGPRMVTNTSGNPHRIGGITIPIGGAYYLTDQDLTNKRLMQKVEYAIKLKVLSRGVSG